MGWFAGTPGCGPRSGGRDRPSPPTHSYRPDGGALSGKSVVLKDSRVHLTEFLCLHSPFVDGSTVYFCQNATVKALK